MEALGCCNHAAITSKLQHLKASCQLSAPSVCTRFTFFAFCVWSLGGILLSDHPPPSHRACFVTCYPGTLWSLRRGLCTWARSPAMKRCVFMPTLFSGERVVTSCQTQLPLCTCIITLSFNPSLLLWLLSLSPPFPLGRRLSLFLQAASGGTRGLGRE